MEMARAFRDNPILEKQLARLLYLSPEITRAAYLWLADDYQETVIGLLESARHPGR